MTLREDDTVSNLDYTKVALQHAWDWFALHAGQRMQLINFLLVSIAFLTAGYGTAMNAGRPHVAAWIAIAGEFIALAFWRLDVRTRELIRASEPALAALEARIAELSALPEMELIAIVNRPTKPISSYTAVVRWLVITAVVFYAAGAIYGFTI